MVRQRRPGAPGGPLAAAGAPGGYPAAAGAPRGWRNAAAGAPGRGLPAGAGAPGGPPGAVGAPGGPPQGGPQATNRRVPLVVSSQDPQHCCLPAAKQPHKLAAEGPPAGGRPEPRGAPQAPAGEGWGAPGGPPPPPEGRDHPLGCGGRQEVKPRRHFLFAPLETHKEKRKRDNLRSSRGANRLSNEGLGFRV